jgi:hypothetical protein
MRLKKSVPALVLLGLAGPAWGQAADPWQTRPTGPQWAFDAARTLHGLVADGFEIRAYIERPGPSGALSIYVLQKERVAYRCVEGISSLSTVGEGKMLDFETHFPGCFRLIPPKPDPNAARKR